MYKRQVYTNCYFLKNKETGEALIVDPADSPKRIFQKVEDMGAKPVGILLTHGHFDHIMAVQAVKAEYQIPVYACRQEEEMLREPSVNMTDRMHKPCSVRPVSYTHLDVYKRQVYTKPACKDCFARFYCSGGCAANGYHAHKDIRSNYEIGCELQRKRVECAIMIKAALAEEDVYKRQVLHLANLQVCSQKKKYMAEIMRLNGNS